MWPGIFFSESFDADSGSGDYNDGDLFIRNIDARFERRSLHLRESICRVYFWILVGNADRRIFLSPSILQAPKHECLRGTKRKKRFGCHDF